ncbi:phosphotransferase [Acidobacteria bacterium AH-259-D05]|nr:phosphotransferase [Acidobacteria bacterium AH-259-D05]
MTNSFPIPPQVTEFLQREFSPGYNPSNVNKLPGDASTRQYFRYQTPTGESFILALYPKPFDPENFNYRQVYDLLQQISLPVPKIIALDSELSIVLQDDLGDESLQRKLLVADKGERNELLSAAIDHIVTLQQEGTKALKPEYQASGLAFDQEKLNSELLFFRRHYLGDYRQVELLNEDQLTDEFDKLTAELAGFPRCLCHRDYHVRNLMLKDGKIYITDFQDARRGPYCYDLVSLLKDSIELDEQEIDQYQDYYLNRAALPTIPQDFSRQFHLMCIQRLLKALGTYGYQIRVCGNHIYRQYIPGSLHRVLLSLQSIPEFPYIQSIVQS